MIELTKGFASPWRGGTLLAAMVLVGVPAIGAEPPVQVFVWPGGDDSAAGTRDAPLQSLASAFERVRGNGRPSVISLAAGLYPIAEPIRLGKKDTRSADAPLIVRRVGKRGAAVLTGGLTLPNDRWRETRGDDRLAPFLPKASRRQVVVMELAGSPAAELFTHRPDPDKRQHPPQVSWSGYLLQHSRWPNRGYAYIDKVLNPGPRTRQLKPNEPKPAYSFEKPTGGSFTLKNAAGHEPLDLAALAAEFAATGDMRVEGYASNDWYFQKEMLGRVDPAKRSLQLVRYTRYGVGGEKIKLPRRVRLVNSISNLDQPGEWCFDHREKKLYLWPVAPPKGSDNPVQIIGGKGLISANGVSHVRIEGLTFEAFGDTAVNFQNASHVTIAGCEFRAAAGVAARVQGGVRNTIRSCDVHDVGSGLIMSGVPANRKNLTPEHNRMINNHIWNLHSRGYGGAASMRGVGGYFAHNVLHGMQNGLRYGDNDFVAEYNEFYNMGFEMGDWNPCYAGADLSLQNNTFRYNLFHHLIETPGAKPIAAIRADDGASGLHVHANLFFKTGRAAVQFHGPGSSITNNFLVGVPLLWWSVQSPSEKISKQQFMQKKRSELAKIRGEVAAGTRSANDKLNILGRAERVFGEEGWKTNEAWRSRYPEFAEHFSLDDYDRSPWAQSFARVKNNFIDDESFELPVYLHGRNEVKTLADVRRAIPGTAEVDLPQPYTPSRVFKSPGGLDFRVNRRPPKGVEKIDFLKIGLVKDPYRKSMPDKARYRRDVVRLYRGVSSHRGDFDLAAINRRYQPPEYLRRSK